ncbi:MAG TPA: hypothetical protein VJZ01_03785 [Lachnospiraceae bacterium]|jgi:uncharacterized protein|nr:hypothetical protein [Lachnospiraceae bacterium]
MARDLEYITYGKPIKCSICNGPLVYKGVGEYQCSECFNLEYDDYGKVRLYIESHNGATASEISEATEVSQAKIRQMLKEERLEVASDSRAFLHCEACGKEIRSGQFCSECEAKRRREGVSEKKSSKMVGGFGAAAVTDRGEKRFRRP